MALKKDSNQFEQLLTQPSNHYLAQISIEVTQNSINDSKYINRVTLLASVFLPLNIITGLFGMNVKVPGLGEDTFAWFYAIIGFMILFSMIVGRRLYKLPLNKGRPNSFIGKL